MSKTETAQDRLRKLRESKMLSLRETARLAGIGYAWYACIEQGSIDPCPGKLTLIAYALGVEPNKLIQDFIF
jgi:transcriptional regulator with XRE-family HTH domain